MRRLRLDAGKLISNNDESPTTGYARVAGQSGRCVL
jgi:hypothetical protein